MEELKAELLDTQSELRGVKSLLENAEARVEKLESLTMNPTLMVWGQKLLQKVPNGELNCLWDMEIEQKTNYGIEDAMIKVQDNGEIEILQGTYRVQIHLSRALCIQSPLGSDGMLGVKLDPNNRMLIDFRRKLDEDLEFSVGNILVVNFENKRTATLDRSMFKFGGGSSCGMIVRLTITLLQK